VKIRARWEGKMRFLAEAGDNTSPTDAPAPLGNGSALSPKQLLLASICGCTGIDVAARMRKQKQELKALYINAEAPKREGKPATFDSVTLDFHFEGAVEQNIAIASVVSSQSEDCGVSAMIAAHCPIHYRVHLNGELVHSGTAKFSGVQTPKE
jgi:putative redox protein